MADKVGVVRPAGPVFINHNSTIFPLQFIRAGDRHVNSCLNTTEHMAALKMFGFFLLFFCFFVVFFTYSYLLFTYSYSVFLVSDIYENCRKSPK